MDKNLKADLVAFRNEVISNIKNIEDVVGKIDDKLQDETTTSCLSRCPEIADLLEQCKTVKWHTDVDQQQVVNFTKSVNKVYDRLSIIESSKFAEYMSDIVRLSNKLESKLNEQTKKEITQLAEKQITSTQDETHNNSHELIEKMTLITWYPSWSKSQTHPSV